MKCMISSSSNIFLMCSFRMKEIKVSSASYTSAKKMYSTGWLIAFTGSAINIVLGSWYSWSVIGKTISREWGWSPAQSSLPFALLTMSFSITMIFAGRLQDRTGPRLVAIAGGLLMGSAMFLSSFSQNPLTIAFTYGILGGAGVAVGHSGTVPVAIKWVPPQRKGLASGIVVAGVGLAAVFMTPLTHLLIINFGIQGTFRIMGVVIALAVPLLGIALRNPPEGFRSAQKEEFDVNTGATVRERDWLEVLKTPQFYGIWFMFMLSASPVLMVIANSVQILSLPKEQIFNPVVAPILVVSFSAGGRILSGYVSDRIGRRRTLVVVFMIQALNVVGLSLYETQYELMTAFALAGLLYGAFFPLLPAIMSDFYGLKHLGVNYGIIGTAFGTAGILGTQLGGYVKELLLSYDPAYWIFSGMLCIAALLAFVTKNPHN